jgi:hypothetical protein
MIIGFWIAGCEESKERQNRDVGRSGGGPQVEVTVQQ